MKDLLIILLLVFLNLNCFALEESNLPEIPWANLVEMHSKPETTNGQWGVNVQIKLVGSYNSIDSLIIAEAVKQLDAITETISIGFSQSERGNLEVFFIDPINADFPGYYFSYHLNSKNEKIPENSDFISDEGRTYSRVIIEKEKISPIYYRQILKNRIAKEIGGGHLTDGYFLTPNGTARTIEALKIAKNRNSIFNRYENPGAHREELNELDIAIIKATYQPDYKEKLELAREQFKVDPWWLKVNPSIILLLPFGILFLVFSFVALSVFNWLSGKVANHFLSFNLKVFVSLVLIIFLLTNFSYFNQYWYHLAQGKFPVSPVLFAKKYIFNFMYTAVFFFPVVNLIAYLESTIQKRISNQVLQFGLVFSFTFLIPLLVLIILNIISFRKFDEFTENDAISQVSIAFIIFLVIAGFRVIISYFLRKERDLISQKEEQFSLLRELKTKAELNVLHSRINPHFLYNSLNSIAGLAHENADKTEHMALSLSKLFRYSVNKQKSDWTTFKEELEMVKIYLDVEKVRFDERLTYSIKIPKELEEQKIPRFIIQPLVENAVKHGVAQLIDGGQIKVDIYKKGKNIVIAVSDSGEPFPDDLIPGFGIQSIYDKLEILYKDKFEMNFINYPDKQVTLKLN